MLDKKIILDKLDFPSFYKQYIADLEPGGDYSQSKSPFRDEEQPSFTIYWRDGGWKDFGSGESGDVFSFVQKIENIDFKSALKKLANFAGVNLNGQGKKNALPDIKAAIHEKTIENLQNKQPEPIFKILQKRKISLQICKRFRIGAQTRYNNPEIIFPFAFENNNVTAYKKFYWRDGKKQQAMKAPLGIWPQEVLAEDVLILCAGEFDCLSLISNGFNAVTAMYGEGTFKSDWGQLFVDKDVTIIYDYDDAGRKGARHAAEVIFPFARSVAIADWSGLPGFQEKKGYDAGDFFEEKRQIDELIELFDRAKDFVPIMKISEGIREDNEKRKKEHLAWDLKDLFYEETKNGFRLLQTKVSEWIRDEYQFCATEQGSKTVFFRYNEGVWEKISSRIIRKLILGILAMDTTSYVIRSIIDLLADLVFIPWEKFNSRTDLIPLRNCVYDLKNFKPIKHSPEFYFTFKNDYDFDMTADCPHFDRALAEYALHDAEWLTAFWEIAGYCMTGSYEIQKMFWFTGARGGNGKGTVTRVMQKIVGVELTKPNLSPSKLDGQFYKKALIGKRLAITGDLPPFMKNIDTIKELTGGDRQSTDVKFGDMEDFENSAKLVIAMNRMPTFAANEPIQPILRRVYLLPFDYQIEKYDMDIEMRFESELSGIFNKAIIGLKRLRAQREFSICSRGQKQMNIYSGSLNSFQEYMTEKLVFNLDESVWLTELWENYKFFMEEVAGQFWENKGEHITNRTLFQRELQARSGAKIETERAYNEVRQGTYIRYKGVGFRKRDVPDNHIEEEDEEQKEIW